MEIFSHVGLQSNSIFGVCVFIFSLSALIVGVVVEHVVVEHVVFVWYLKNAVFLFSRKHFIFGLFQNKQKHDSNQNVHIVHR